MVNIGLNMIVVQEQQRVVSQGAGGIEQLGAGDAAAAGARAVGAEISPKHLKEMLTYPPDWGPTQWVRFSPVQPSSSHCNEHLAWPSPTSCGRSAAVDVALQCESASCNFMSRAEHHYASRNLSTGSGQVHAGCMFLNNSATGLLCSGLKKDARQFSFFKNHKTKEASDAEGVASFALC